MADPDWLSITLILVFELPLTLEGLSSFVL